MKRTFLLLFSIGLIISTVFSIQHMIPIEKQAKEISHCVSVEKTGDFGTKSIPTYYEWRCGNCQTSWLGGDCVPDPSVGYRWQRCWKYICNDFGGYVECTNTYETDDRCC